MSTTHGDWARSIVTHVGEETWEWSAQRSGRMVDFGPVPNQNGEGCLRRIGDAREPSHWMAWGETCVGRV